MISIKEYYPSTSLSLYVDSYYQGIFNTASEANKCIKISPTGCLELIIHLEDRYCKLPSGNSLSYTPDYMLIGIFSKTYQVHFSEKVPVFSIRFKPHALQRILGIKGSEVFEKYGDIQSLLGNRLLNFCNRIREDDSLENRIYRTEKFLIHLLSETRLVKNYVSTAVDLIYHSRMNNIHELPGMLNISLRQLERKFKDQLGMTPKQYHKLIRINKALNLLRQNHTFNLTEIAYSCGYFDQAHFIKDFKQVTSQTPSSFIEQRMLSSF